MLALAHPTAPTWCGLWREAACCSSHLLFRHRESQSNSQSVGRVHGTRAVEALSLSRPGVPKLSCLHSVGSVADM